MEHIWRKCQTNLGKQYNYKNEEKCINCGLETFITASGWRVAYTVQNVLSHPVISCDEFIIKSIIE
jgi:hypothetical protein